ncbi:protein UPSTREAM OF FLC-like [Dorcoceras hygrometricum]|uniref:Protein UPSTREAM OF FLC-like n=1 Tax=Dorcoceras hygrometricum TaxID=472368 RepID=A0A2Z7AZ48_9LAMI|nr:protein UPSTREAM OF FLC-like [Dorcoceras hygrometricum]
MAVSSSSRHARMPELQSTKLWREQRGEISPERTVVWAEPSKLKTDKRVPVIYYLSRNGQLEHPHFMEVPLSSPQALYLRDVINRLNVLRGKGMTSMYSWSCKRNYKNRFVWHDLSENDLIHPAHGNEYVLKGSELLETTFMETLSSFQRQQQPLALPPPAGDNQIIGVHDLDYPKASAERRRRNQSCSSIDFNLHEYGVYKADTSSGTDASTQTEDKRRRRRAHGEIVEDEIEISPPTSDSSPETLETLMKSDKRPILIPAKESEDPTANNHREKGKASSVLMQLISCGSISFKDCGTGQGLGLISQYKMRMPRAGATVGRGRVKLEEKEYFSGSIVETKKEEYPSLKRSTSYGAERSSQLEIPEKDLREKCSSRKPKTQQSSTQKEETNGLTCSATIIDSCP